MKLQIKTANVKKTTFDKSSTHISTLDFGRHIVSNILPVIQGDSVHSQLRQFVRLSPLAVPTYGNMKLVTRAYYVPCRLLSPLWMQFKIDQNNANSNNSLRLPYCSNADIVNFFVNGYSEIITSGIADFTIGSKNYVLLERGRVIFQLLQCLGYSINWSTDDTTEFSLMPLLAYLRVVFDICYPSRYVDYSLWSSLFYNDTYDKNTDLPIILDNLVASSYTFYENDFFAESWKSFNSATGNNPVANVNGTTYINAPDGSNTRATITPNNIAIQQNSASSTITISSYAHQLLDRLSDFALRNNLAGQRFLDQIKARFGYTTNPQDEQFAKFLGSYVDNVNIMDVTNTTQSQESELGEMAGKGYISGNGTLTYDAKEDGYILFISQIVPSYGYVQGRKPWTLDKTSYLDLYNPEFDGIGNEPLRNDIIFADYTNSTQYTNGLTNGGRPNGVFGFVPRYSTEYKRGYDFLTGDFRFNSRNVGMQSFHTFRMLEAPTSTTNALQNNLTFRQINKDYSRIFSTSFDGNKANYDHFVCYFEFGHKVSSNMKSYSEQLPFYEAEGRETTIETQ